LAPDGHPVAQSLPQRVRDLNRFDAFGQHSGIDEPMINERLGEDVVLLPSGDQLRHDAVMRVEEIGFAVTGVIKEGHIDAD
jgi:hypothetical protein